MSTELNKNQGGISAVNSVSSNVEIVNNYPEEVVNNYNDNCEVQCPELEVCNEIVIVAEETVNNENDSEKDRDETDSNQNIDNLDNNQANNVGSYKKKFGKFRILSGDQSPSQTDSNSVENVNEENNSDSEKKDSVSKPLPEPFIPPTLLADSLNNEDNIDTKNDEENSKDLEEDNNEEEIETEDSKPKRGRPPRKKGRKKLVASKTAKKNQKIDSNENEDLIASRRRSTRLKTLEEKKESDKPTTDKSSNDNDELCSNDNNENNETVKIESVNSEDIPVIETITSITNKVDNEKTSVQEIIKENIATDVQNDNSEAIKDVDIPKKKERNKDKFEEKTRDKEKRKKDKKNKTKKHKQENKDKDDKRRRSRRKKSRNDMNEQNSKMEDSNSDNENSNNFKSNLNDCFTPPSIFNSNKPLKSNMSSNSRTSDNDENPKPEKVKSRWRRNSELESGHSNKDTFSSSENFNYNNSSPSSYSALNSHTNFSDRSDENTEPMPDFSSIDSNLYLIEKKKTKFTKEVKKMVCDCILTKEERARGIMGCGEDCLNRMLMIECGSRCPLGDHCSNKRFLKKQYSKVEPFKTNKKGWGLKATQQLQPGQFIMEYVGEVLGPSEFRSRVKRYSKEERVHHFFMALKSDEIIDATLKGNITRFINHSCNPNSETQKWTVNGDLRIGFFTTKYVEAGEEITFDYQFQRYGKEAQKCFCESFNCRGYIGATDVSNKVEIDIGDDTKSSIVKIKSKDKDLIEKTKEEFEDLGLEEEIEKLKDLGGLRNRQQTLMLARLMVRADEVQSRLKLIQIIKDTQENACLRLLLDYHGLQLIWSWMVDLEDVYLKAEIIKLLEFLPIPNKTMLKDSKVFDVIEKWSKIKDEVIMKKEDTVKSDKNLTSENSLQVNGLADNNTVNGDTNSKEFDDLSKEDTSETRKDLITNEIKHNEDNLEITDQSKDAEIAENKSITNEKSEVKDHKGFTIIKKETKNNLDNKDDKCVPSISMMATRLLNLWKDLKEVYRIPRLERQKRHEDEKEADRKALENEENNSKLFSLHNRENTLLRRNLKRSFDSYKNKQYTNSQTNINNQNLNEYNYQNKISREEHRAYYNVELMRKDYEEAMKHYKKQIEQYNAAIQHQISMNPAIPIAIQPPMPPAPPPSIFPTPSINSYENQNYFNIKTINSSNNYNMHNQSGIIPQQTYSQNQYNVLDKNLPHTEYNTYSSINNDNFNNFTSAENEYNNLRTYENLNDHSNYQSYQNYSESDLTNYDYANHQDQDFHDQSYTEKDNQLLFDKSWNTTFNELISGSKKNLVECTDNSHSLMEDEKAIIQSDYGLKLISLNQKNNVKEEDNVDLFDKVYPTPGTYFVCKDKTYFIPCNFKNIFNQSNTNLTQINIQTSVIENVPNFYFPSKVLTKDLPKNWRFAKDKNGYYYYFNEITKKTQWHVPKEEKDSSLISKILNKSLDNVKNVVVTIADSTSTPRMEVNETNSNTDNNFSSQNDLKEDSLKKKVTTELTSPSVNINPVINSQPNGLSDSFDYTSTDLDPRKKLKTIYSNECTVLNQTKVEENNELSPIDTSLSLDIETKVIKFPQQSVYQRHYSERKSKEKFKSSLSEHIKNCLNPYRKHDCKIGRILCNDDFKILARKLTHIIMLKELKHCKSSDSLVVSDIVKHKSKDFVKKYMSKFGPFYKPDEKEERDERGEDKEEKLSSPVFNSNYLNSAQNSNSNSANTTPTLNSAFSNNAELNEQII